MDKFEKKYPKWHKGIRYAGNALKIAQQAYSMATTIAAVVNSEKKYSDITHAIDVDTNASITCLTQIAQGDTGVSRDGNTVALKSLQIDGCVNFDAGNAQEMVRVMLVRANDDMDGTAPAITDILETASVVALRNHLTPKDYTVMYDKLFTHDDARLVKHISYFKKFKNFKDKRGNPTVSQKLYFNGVNGDDYTKGHIFLIVFGTVANAGTSTTFNGYSRIRFYDN